MSFDNSRFTFDPFNDYSGVVMEQGRVQTDADWNEWLSEISRRIQAGTLDIMGRAAYPATTPYAFQIAADNVGGTNTIKIGLGRMYVDGLLAENHGDRTKAVWDPALAELSGSPQPPPPQTGAPSIDFGSQTYNRNAAVPQGTGTYLAYLDVWRRPITYIEDQSLVDVAIGIDTAGRLQTAWQVNLMPMSDSSFTVTGSVSSGIFFSNEEVKQATSGATANLIGTVTGSNPMTIGPVAGKADAADLWTGQTSGAVYSPTAAPVPSIWSCATPDSSIPWPTTSGRLTTRTITSGPSGPCCLTTGTGYTGVENQFYRVEIHTPGIRGGGNATFKWSRENGSVQTGVTGISIGTNSLGAKASVLTVLSLGRDQVLGFSPGNWIEITNQTLDDNCQPGELYQIDGVEVSSSTITLTTLLSNNFPASSLAPTSNKYTRICRWDQSGKIYKSDNSLYYDLDADGAGGVANGSGGIPLPQDGSTLILENGITVQFGLSLANGVYLAMDYWNFAARTADGTLDPLLNLAPPRGIYHHRTKLSIVTLGTSHGATDCRTKWVPSDTTDCGCCTCTVGDGVQSVGMYNSIQAAIMALPSQGGQVCILPGHYYEYILLQGLTDVVIYGCGWQTHVYSRALQPGSNATLSGSGSSPKGGAASGSKNSTSSAESGLRAVFTVVGCQHVEFRSFSVHAADQEAGILLDRSSDTYKKPVAGGSGIQPEFIIVEKGTGDTDVIIEKLVVTASTLPAIIAADIKRMKIAENRIAIKNTESLWPAVYMSGEELFFERNWVGLREDGNPAIGTLTAQTNAAEKATPSQKAGTQVDSTNLVAGFGADSIARANGGIQIAGPSKNVFVVENEIIGGRRNGISLGNFVILDANGADTGALTGLLTVLEDECSTGGSGQIPGTTSGSNPSGIGAGGVIQDLHIDRNRIHQMGMCGIGPVGFFDLTKTLEVISLVNVHITENSISHTLLRAGAVYSQATSSFGYGAVSVPDVQNLIIRDNIITDFGVTAGAEVCGIFVLHGEIAEISRNQIKETRDFSFVPGQTVDSFGGIRAGILMLLVTLPTTQEGAIYTRSTLVFEPGLSALRVQENVVRVAIGLALEAFGFGPFEIVGNNFGSGGFLSLSSAQDTKPIQPTGAGSTFAFSGGQAASNTGTPAGALLVGVVNLGFAIEATTLYRFGQAFGDNNVSVGSLAGLNYYSNGAVLFTNNICQLEAVLSGVSGFASVVIASLDHVLFANNHLWLNGPSWVTESPGASLLDAFIFGTTIQVCANRLQESALYPVVASGWSLGFLNITSQNISTYCLIASALPGGQTMAQENLAYLCKM